ncbi:kinesin-like protein Nod [Drosophila biarmipes]|uniref:kinesin-like protein Nod n=1 Tax=Drosophila biarmipes TaxID=125945 RepID=UPI0007E725EA|nr:kinesin-like protein Nod [Drosophila biarmipes]
MDKLSAVRIAAREAPYRQFLGRREPSVVEFPPWGDGKSLVVEQNEFHFDHAFPSTVGQDEMYLALIRPLVEKALQGFQCTALAYGQTGTGKSYSMGMAPPDKVQKPEHLGVLPRCLADILDRVTAKQENEKEPIQVFASFIEIYNEKAYDLLGSIPQTPMVAARCQRCTCLPLRNQEDLQDLLQQGTGNRRVRSTKMNSSSSRSHAIVTIHVKSSTSHSRLNIVDLAGSEGVRRTGHEGVAKQEGVNINLGLLSINKVVMSMAAGRTVIPYRDSVLTTVLQESLTAQSYLTFLACISPHRCDLSETLATLRFGTSAKKLRLNPMQVARQKQSLATRTPHVFRKVLSSSTAIKRQAAEQNSLFVPNPKSAMSKPLTNVLHRTRSELGLTPKAKKRARELLQLEDTTLEPSSIHISDSSLSLVGFQAEVEKDRQLMPPPGVGPGQPGSLHSTAVSIAEVDELEEPAEVQQSLISGTVHSQLFRTNVSPIRLRSSSILKELSGIQPMEETLIPPPKPPSVLRRSMRLANQSRQNYGAIPKIANFRNRQQSESRESSASVTVKKEKVTQLKDLITQVEAPPKTSRSRKKKSPTDDWMAHNKSLFLGLLNRGSVKELQKVPGIGPKTAFTLVMHRSRLGCFLNLGQVKDLPIWPGKSWDRFSQANCLEI